MMLWRRRSDSRLKRLEVRLAIAILDYSLTINDC